MMPRYFFICQRFDHSLLQGLQEMHKHITYMGRISLHGTVLNHSICMGGVMQAALRARDWCMHFDMINRIQLLQKHFTKYQILEKIQGKIYTKRIQLLKK